jgi:hypothetical protein
VVGGGGVLEQGVLLSLASLVMCFCAKSYSVALLEMETASCGMSWCRGHVVLCTTTSKAVLLPCR